MLAIATALAAVRPAKDSDFCCSSPDRPPRARLDMRQFRSAAPGPRPCDESRAVAENLFGRNKRNQPELDGTTSARSWPRHENGPVDICLQMVEQRSADRQNSKIPADTCLRQPEQKPGRIRQPSA